MRLYLDTSALVKVYITETGSEMVEDLVARCERISISMVGYAEARAAFARRLRSRDLTEVAYRGCLDQLDRDWKDLDRVLVNEPLVHIAGHLATRHGLRGFDAIHLASAISAQRKDGDDLVFVSFDRDLAIAAEAEGLALAR